MSARELARDAPPELRAAFATLARAALDLLAEFDGETTMPAAPVAPRSAPRVRGKAG